MIEPVIIHGHSVNLRRDGGAVDGILLGRGMPLVVT
jgi:hypothetical protein